MAQQREGEELIPLAVRIALRNAVGGWGPYNVRQITELFNMHAFTDFDASVPDAGGERRTAAEGFHTRIDWSSADQARRYLALVSDVLEHYPEEEDVPGSPGRVLRRALTRANLLGPDGEPRLPMVTSIEEIEPDIEGIWAPGRPRIFMSHVSAARERVAELAEALESLGCSCFVAHVQIQPSRDWQDTIEIALATCHALVAYVTPDFPTSDWTEQEVGWVLGRRALIVPVNAGLQPYGLFGARQSVPDSGSWSVTFAFRLFVAIARESLRPGLPTGAPHQQIAAAIVHAFCVSPNFDSTRERFPLLSLIPIRLWTDEMLDQLLEAKTSNRQIADGVLVEPQRIEAPEAIDDLVSRIVRGEAP